MSKSNASWSGEYIPTPEEIAEACAEIQAGWDEATERSRRVIPASEGWTPPLHREPIRQFGCCRRPGIVGGANR